ncbi:iron-containing alcohol dehydrogenase [Wenzhouxiangella sp. XN24]|uniref:iron-containing alcohol dehydrogenase n=1 Tax=Wenzhouxiangella sp. XN24 TaxID=2713569 RepID=UPI0013ECCE29|nr:iron-containing alcohol dehydrogenase [Wenzhouxiangella sp. XN24]
MKETYYEFSCSVKLIVGARALENIPFELGAIGAKKPLLVTDRGVAAAGLVDTLREILSTGGLEIAAVYDEVPPDSSLTAVRAIAAIYRDRGCDSLIALGGGSPIDTAKAANILASYQTDDPAKYSGVGNLPRPLNPLLVIPTTAGTGSEVTYVSIVKDEERGVKVPFASPFLMPHAAVLDPRMTLGLPAQITAATAMDAMTHACEAFICLAKNPMSDAYAAAAVRAVSENLLQVLDRPGDEQGRLALAQGAAMAGIAFSNSMVGLVHALGHSVGAMCHVHHGTCMSILLPAVLEYNLEARRDVIGELLLPLAGADIYASTPASERAEKAIARLRWLKDEIHARCGLPRTLSETGKVEQSQLEEIAEMSLDDGSIIFNPVEVDREEALAVLRKSW